MTRQGQQLVVHLASHPLLSLVLIVALRGTRGRKAESVELPVLLLKDATFRGNRSLSQALRYYHKLSSRGS